MSASYNAKYPDKWCWCELATFELHSFTCPKEKDTDIFKIVKKQKSLRQMSFVVVVDCLLPGKDVY